MSESEPIAIDAGVHSIAVAILERWESRADSPFASIVVDHLELLVKVYRVPGDTNFDADVQSSGTDRVPVLEDVVPWTYPPVCDFLYGE
jgi:aminoglycoside 9-adenylyltransferase